MFGTTGFRRDSRKTNLTKSCNRMEVVKKQDYTLPDGTLRIDETTLHNCEKGPGAVSR